MSRTLRREVGADDVGSARSKSMFSSWSPISALVAGVKIGVGSFDAMRSPGGSITPQTAPLSWYSFQPLPAR